MRAFFSFLVVLLVLAGLGMAANRWEETNFVAPGPAPRETVVIIKPGSGLAVMADQLADARVVDNSLLFRLGVLRRGKRTALKAGEYAFPAHASMAQVTDMLVERKVVQHRLTIAEGLTSDMAVALVKADPFLDGPVPTVPEGSLLPETYLFERGTTRAELLARMHKAQEKLIAELWPKRSSDLPLASPAEAITLASIVEKETGVPEERPLIAAVFFNRLRMHMKLESDPTIIYGLTKGVPLGHSLRQSELDTPNPYSTYQIDGLTPTPICNPGRDAIAAVLHPTDSDELYFVANGSGGHAFAKTVEEHQKNVAQWRKLERAENGGDAATGAPPRLR